MKNMKRITILSLIVLIAALFSVCEHIGLGEKLHMAGPVVKIESPLSRQPVDGKFILKGNITDEKGVEWMYVKARYFTNDGQNMDFPIQWRYVSSVWEISLNSGETWSILEPVTLADGTVAFPVWTGKSRSATFSDWEVPIDMLLAGNDITDGLYQFTVIARNIIGNSDERSLSSRNVIFYKEPPKVEIVFPILMSRSDPELLSLSNLTDWRDPIYIGKLLNNEFNLQWRITEENDLWAIEILFYELRENNSGDYIDPICLCTDECTGCENFEDEWVFRMYINDINNRPTIPSQDQLDMRPNGRIKVPDLSNGTGILTDGSARYQVNKNFAVSGNTPLQVVVRCMNAAGLELEERIQGCFVYWPDSDIPWITFPEGLSDDHTKLFYPVFPGDPNDPDSGVPAKAFDDDGIEYVEYTIFYAQDNGSIIEGPVQGFENIKIDNSELRTKNFSWTFKPPQQIRKYKIEAIARDIHGLYSPLYSGYFETQDVSWPDILAPYTPVSTAPLYRYKQPVHGIFNPPSSESQIMGNNSEEWNFTIEGLASDATGVRDIFMVWINPRSANYAAMSQLAYFRDPNYEGWLGAEEHWKNITNPAVFPTTAPYLDNESDPARAAPNKIWKLNLSPHRLNDLRRREVTYSINLNLKNDLHIWPGVLNYDFLRSQVFVFKVTNGGGDKTSIIVWSPEGASLAPDVKIDEVWVNETRQNLGTVEEIDLIIPTDTITVKGRWREDSVRYLGIPNALMQYFNVTIGTAVIKHDPLMNTEFTITQFPSPDSEFFDGGWEIIAKVGNADETDEFALRAGHIRDTLMVNAEITNIGGHKSEDMQTWFIATDQLRFLKLGSNTSDSRPFRAGQPIEFYLEFNKPVKLKDGAAVPKLLLNSGEEENLAIAEHFIPASSEEYSTMQFFRYIVSAGHSTQNLTEEKLLNISSLHTTLTIADANYPFTFVTSENETVYMTAAGVSGDYHYVLPMDVNNASGSLRTIRSFEVDTTPPVLEKIVISGRGGWYGRNNTLILSADFSEDVFIGTPPPQITLQISNGIGDSINTTPKAVTDVRQNGRSLIFYYDIRDNDFTEGTSVVQVTSFTGTVQDFAGNTFNTALFAGMGDIVKVPRSNQGLGEGARIKAIDIAAPTLRVYDGSALRGDSEGGHLVWDPGAYTTSREFNDAFTGQILKLGNYYSENLSLTITSNAVVFEEGFDRLEYSINYGKNWSRGPRYFTNNAIAALTSIPNAEIGDFIRNTHTAVRQFGSPGSQISVPVNGLVRIVTLNPFVCVSAVDADLRSITINQSIQGQYDLTARQIDGAGNTSPWSKPVTLLWDKGALLTSISTDEPSGIYTYSSSTPTSIPITLTFRRPVTVSNDSEGLPPRLRLNVGDRRGGAHPAFIEIDLPLGNCTGFTTGTPPFTITAAYTVLEYHTTNQNALNVLVGEPNNPVSLITGIFRDNNEQEVTHMVSMELVTTSNRNLAPRKNIIIQTGRPSLVTPPAFRQTGINSDDSVAGLIALTYDNPVSRGMGEIEIRQVAADYRLPGILTEAQFNLYKNIILDDKYYKRGTNGFINGTGPDTSTKYILDFNVNTFDTSYRTIRADGTPDPATVIADSTKTTELREIRDSLLNAEGINILVNSTFVNIYNNVTAPPVGARIGDFIHNFSDTAATIGGISVPANGYARITALTPAVNPTTLTCVAATQADVTTALATPARLVTNGAAGSVAALTAVPAATPALRIGDFIQNTGNLRAFGAAPAANQVTVPANGFVRIVSLTPTFTCVVVNANQVVFDTAMLYTRGRTVTVTLTSTNSLKVQGADYTMTYPEGFVQDKVGGCLSMTEEIARTDLSTDGRIPANRVGTLARPFIRTMKPVERISESLSYSNTQPRFYVAYADRATRAWVRMDTRTPGAVVRYTANSSPHTAAGVNLNEASDGIGEATKALTAPGRPGTLPVASTNNLFNATGIHSCTDTACVHATHPAVHQVGEAPNTSSYESIDALRYRIYAVSEKGGLISAIPAEEMLYRSVLTFVGQTGTMSNQVFGNGDQVWVRGGNNTSSSTIAGFPLTWADNYTQLQASGDRAGIRLLTRINDDETTLALSTWQWITWELSAPAFIALNLGRDVTDNTRISTLVEVQQYGPKTFAVQRDNWTLLFEHYRLHPGTHRYLVTNSPTLGGGGGSFRQDPFNFSATPERRPVLTITGQQ